MNVNGITFDRYQTLDAGRLGRSQRTEADDADVLKKAEAQAEIEEPPTADEPEPTEEEETQEAKGVLRLLQEGHFKGVAAIRLRINFSEELAGCELPELSAPKGNGGAYQKFLEIYQGMQTTNDTDVTETPDNPDPIDVVA